MPKLYLKFNDSFEYVKLKLEGSGTYQVEEKREHIDILCFELVNYIKHERPSKLIFDGVFNDKLIKELSKVGITYNLENNKLTY